MCFSVRVIKNRGVLFCGGRSLFRERVLVLACFEVWVLLIDEINAVFVVYDLVVLIARFGGFERVTDFHRGIP